MNYSIRYLTMIIDLFIVFIVVASIKKALRNSRGTGTRRSTNNTVNRFNDMINTYNTANSNKVSSGGKHDGMTLADDRANDWMARQLKDEAVAMAKVSDMFKIRQEHMNKCDAEFIKRFHESSCDAEGIDDGTRKRK